MFTGIVETVGSIIEKQINGSNIRFAIRSSLSSSLKIDQSLSHDGCCLTITEIDNDIHYVDAIAETLAKTNLQQWEPTTQINLERCTLLNGRLDGHIVQGHVDTTGVIEEIELLEGSHSLWISHPENKDFYTVSRGSITVNGVSLTVAESLDNKFKVSIIPYTWDNTNFKHLRKGDSVNLEFDIIGKYIAKMVQQQLNAEYKK